MSLKKKICAAYISKDNFCENSNIFGHCAFNNFAKINDLNKHEFPFGEIDVSSGLKKSICENKECLFNYCPSADNKNCGNDRLKSKGGNVVFTDNIVCFKNPYNANDSLCIFKDYDQGLAAIDCIEKDKLKDRLNILFTDADKLNLINNDDHLCFHKAGKGSVMWTHLHIFNDKIKPYPDNINPYCRDSKCSTYCSLYKKDKKIIYNVNDIFNQIHNPIKKIYNKLIQKIIYFCYNI